MSACSRAGHSESSAVGYCHIYRKRSRARLQTAHPVPSWRMIRRGTANRSHRPTGSGRHKRAIPVFRDSKQPDAHFQDSCSTAASSSRSIPLVSKKRSSATKGLVGAGAGPSGPIRSGPPPDRPHMQESPSYVIHTTDSSRLFGPRGQRCERGATQARGDTSRLGGSARGAAYRRRGASAGALRSADLRAFSFRFFLRGGASAGCCHLHRAICAAWPRPSPAWLPFWQPGAAGCATACSREQ